MRCDGIATADSTWDQSWIVLTIPLPRPAQIFLARPLRGKRPFRGRVVNWMGLSFIEIAVIETIEQTVGGVWQAWYQAD
jgi:hypothetical protein